MDELHLYDDLDEFQILQEKKSKALQEVEERYKESLKTIGELKDENKKLTKNIERIKLGFQTLLDTARSEMKRKDKEIERLRKEKDDICFRRKVPSNDATHFARNLSGTNQFRRNMKDSEISSRNSVAVSEKITESNTSNLSQDDNWDYSKICKRQRTTCGDTIKCKNYDTEGVIIGDPYKDTSRNDNHKNDRPECIDKRSSSMKEHEKSSKCKNIRRSKSWERRKDDKFKCIDQKRSGEHIFMNTDPRHSESQNLLNTKESGELQKKFDTELGEEKHNNRSAKLSQSESTENIKHKKFNFEQVDVDILSQQPENEIQSFILKDSQKNQSLKMLDTERENGATIKKTAVKSSTTELSKLFTSFKVALCNEVINSTPTSPDVYTNSYTSNTVQKPIDITSSVSNSSNIINIANEQVIVVPDNISNESDFIQIPGLDLCSQSGEFTELDIIGTSIQIDEYFVSNVNKLHKENSLISFASNEERAIQSINTNNKFIEIINIDNYGTLKENQNKYKSSVSNAHNSVASDKINGSAKELSEVMTTGIEIKYNNSQLEKVKKALNSKDESTSNTILDLNIKENLELQSKEHNCKNIESNTTSNLGQDKDDYKIMNSFELIEGVENVADNIRNKVLIIEPISAVFIVPFKNPYHTEQDENELRNTNKAAKSNRSFVKPEEETNGRNPNDVDPNGTRIDKKSNSNKNIDKLNEVEKSLTSLSVLNTQTATQNEKKTDLLFAEASYDSTANKTKFVHRNGTMLSNSNVYQDEEIVMESEEEIYSTEQHQKSPKTSLNEKNVVKFMGKELSEKLFFDKEERFEEKSLAIEDHIKEKLNNVELLPKTKETSITEYQRLSKLCEDSSQAEESLREKKLEEAIYVQKEDVRIGIKDTLLVIEQGNSSEKSETTLVIGNNLNKILENFDAPTKKKCRQTQKQPFSRITEAFSNSIQISKRGEQYVKMACSDKPKLVRNENLHEIVISDEIFYHTKDVQTVDESVSFIIKQRSLSKLSEVASKEGTSLNNEKFSDILQQTLLPISQSGSLWKSSEVQIPIIEQRATSKLLEIASQDGKSLNKNKSIEILQIVDVPIRKVVAQTEKEALLSNTQKYTTIDSSEILTKDDQSIGVICSEEIKTNNNEIGEYSKMCPYTKDVQLEEERVSSAIEHGFSPKLNQRASQENISLKSAKSVTMLDSVELPNHLEIVQIDQVNKVIKKDEIAVRTSKVNLPGEYIANIEQSQPVVQWQLFPENIDEIAHNKQKLSPERNSAPSFSEIENDVKIVQNNVKTTTSKNMETSTKLTCIDNTKNGMYLLDLCYSPLLEGITRDHVKIYHNGSKTDFVNIFITKCELKDNTIVKANKILTSANIAGIHSKEQPKSISTANKLIKNNITENEFHTENYPHESLFLQPSTNSDKTPLNPCKDKMQTKKTIRVESGLNERNTSCEATERQLNPYSKLNDTDCYKQTVFLELPGNNASKYYKNKVDTQMNDKRNSIKSKEVISSLVSSKLTQENLGESIEVRENLTRQLKIVEVEVANKKESENISQVPGEEMTYEGSSIYTQEKRVESIELRENMTTEVVNKEIYHNFTKEITNESSLNIGQNRMKPISLKPVQIKDACFSTTSGRNNVTESAELIECMPKQLKSAEGKKHNFSKSVITKEINMEGEIVEVVKNVICLNQRQTTEISCNEECSLLKVNQQVKKSITKSHENKTESFYNKTLQNKRGIFVDEFDKQIPSSAIDTKVDKNVYVVSKEMQHMTQYLQSQSQATQTAKYVSPSRATTLSETYNTSPMLPSISNNFPTPSNFSGIFSKKISSIVINDDDLIKLKTTHFSDKLKEFILPAASVLCNVDNLKNATKSKKNILLDLLDNKNEMTEIEDDADIDTTDGEIVKIKEESFETASTSSNQIILDKKLSNYKLKKSSPSQSDVKFLLNEVKRQTELLKKIGKSKVREIIQRKRKLSANIKSKVNATGKRDAESLTDNSISIKKQLPKRPIGRPRKQVGSNNKKIILDNKMRRCLLKNVDKSFKFEQQIPKIITLNSKLDDKELQIEVKEFVKKNKLAKSNSLESLNIQRNYDSAKNGEHDTIYGKSLSSDNCIENNIKSLDSTGENISAITNRLENSMKILSSTVEKLEICDNPRSSKDSIKQWKTCASQIVSYSKEDDYTNTSISADGAECNRMIKVKGDFELRQLKEKNKVAPKPRIKHQEQAICIKETPDINLVIKSYPVCTSSDKADIFNIKDEHIYSKNILPITNIFSSSRNIKAQENCSITSGNMVHEVLPKNQQYVQKYKLFNKQSLTKPICISLEDISINVRSPKMNLSSFRIPKIKALEDKINNSWKQETYVESQNEESKEQCSGQENKYQEKKHLEQDLESADHRKLYNSTNYHVNGNKEENTLNEVKPLKRKRRSEKCLYPIYTQKLKPITLRRKSVHFPTTHNSTNCIKKSINLHRRIFDSSTDEDVDNNLVTVNRNQSSDELNKHSVTKKQMMSTSLSASNSKVNRKSMYAERLSEIDTSHKTLKIPEEQESARRCYKVSNGDNQQPISTIKTFKVKQKLILAESVSLKICATNLEQVDSKYYAPSILEECNKIVTKRTELMYIEDGNKNIGNHSSINRNVKETNKESKPILSLKMRRKSMQIEKFKYYNKEDKEDPIQSINSVNNFKQRGLIRNCGKATNQNRNKNKEEAQNKSSDLRFDNKQKTSSGISSFTAKNQHQEIVKALDKKCDDTRNNCSKTESSNIDVTEEKLTNMYRNSTSQSHISNQSKDEHNIVNFNSMKAHLFETLEKKPIKMCSKSAIQSQAFKFSGVDSDGKVSILKKDLNKSKEKVQQYSEPSSVVSSQTKLCKIHNSSSVMNAEVKLKSQRKLLDTTPIIVGNYSLRDTFDTKSQLKTHHINRKSTFSSQTLLKISDTNKLKLSHTKILETGNASKLKTHTNSFPDSAVAVEQQKSIKRRRKSTDQKVLVCNSVDNESLIKKRTLITRDLQIPLEPAAKLKQRKRHFKVISTSLDARTNATSFSHHILSPLASPNHPIFHTEVSTQSTEFVASMPMTTNQQDDNKLKEIDSKLHEIFQSPVYTADYKISPVANVTNQRISPPPKNKVLPDVKINEKAHFNWENGQRFLNVSQLNNPTVCITDTPAVYNNSEIKHLSLGSADYRFEKVSDNVINLFISRKRKRKCDD